MPYLIDTDWIIDHLDGVQDAVQLLKELSEEGIAINIVTYMEVYQGIVREPNSSDVLMQFEMFREGISIIPFSLAVARRCANLREYLKKQGK
jgi:predicted nucleic acid-binding protein